MPDPAKLRGRLVEPGVLRAEIRGIPVFVAEGNEPARAGLLFGVGRSDETLRCSGITRFVQHLALSSADAGGTGSVGLGHTEFKISGSLDEVAGFLSSVTAAVSLVPLGDIDAERRALAGTTAAVVSRLGGVALGVRFGARGPGLARHDEYGLRWLASPDIVAWRDRWFTASNAAVWIMAPRVPQMDLALPDGRRPDRTAAHASATRGGIPMWLGVPDAQAALSTLDVPSAPWCTALAIAARRLAAAAMGRPLAGQPEITDLSGGLAHGLLRATDGGTGLDDLLGVVDDLAASGPTREELADAADAVASVASATPVGPEDLQRWCLSELGATRILQRAERVSAQRQLTPWEVAHAMRSVLENALYLTPPGAGLPGGRAEPALRWAAVPVHGMRHAPAAPDPAYPAKHLVIDGTGASLVLDADRCIRIGFGDATAVRLDAGARGLWGSDGLYLEVNPAAWQDGTAVIDIIDGAVAAERTVPPAGTRDGAIRAERWLPPSDPAKGAP